jgi:tetratricopeptide (TPR) repeat protein
MLGEYCYRNFGKYDKAEKMFREAIEINPKNEGGYASLGLVYSFLKEYDKAEEMFRKAIEINPHNNWSILQLGMIYMDLREYAKAEQLFKKAITDNWVDDKLYGALANCYKIQGKDKIAEEYFKEEKKLSLKYYNQVTIHNYRKLKEIVTQKRIRLTCVQYPVRSIEPLKKIFDAKEGIIFVDNEAVFKGALKKTSYSEYFTDCIGGDFGHCTSKGNRLLAENIASVIFKRSFNKASQEIINKSKD